MKAVSSLPSIQREIRFTFSGIIRRTVFSSSDFSAAANEGSGVICFSPLAQGLLTGKYNNGIPEYSRAARSTGFLQVSQVTPQRVEAARSLEAIARERGQSLAQMSLAWALSDSRVTSVIIGTSSVAQMKDNLKTLDNLHFTYEEQARIDAIVNVPGISF